MLIGILHACVPDLGHQLGFASWRKDGQSKAIIVVSGPPDPWGDLAQARDFPNQSYGDGLHDSRFVYQDVGMRVRDGFDDPRTVT